ncbi:MAG: T6SS immunity protein Tdi1 domain-containing protein [Crocinitomicaceae bacterium]
MLKKIAESWNWMGIDPVELISENKFGNVIFKNSDGSYWRIIPEELHCYQIANDLKELKKVQRTTEFIEDWDMTKIVELAESSHGKLKPGYKYYLVIPSVLGGEYSSENIRSVPFEEVIGVSGELGNQIKDLPDGAKIKLSAS